MSNLNSSKQKLNKRTLLRVVRSFKPYAIPITIVLLATLFTSSLATFEPILIQNLFDVALPKHNLSLFWMIIGAMVLIPVVTGIIGIGQIYVNNVVGQRIIHTLRSRLHEHLQAMSMQFFTTKRSGELVSRLSNDITGVQSTLTDTLRNLVSVFSLILSATIAMLLLSPFLTLISFCLMPFFIYFTSKIGNINRKASKKTQESLASLTTIMQESLSINGALLAKTFGRQALLQQRFEKESRKVSDLSIHQQLIGRWFFMITNIFFSLAPVTIYFLAGTQILILHQNSISLGVIIGFTAAQSMIFSSNGPITRYFQIQIALQGSLALFERIYDYMDIPVNIQNPLQPVNLPLEQVQGSVTFRNVYFTYTSDISPLSPDTQVKGEEQVQAPTLKDISFHVEPGQLVALVGPSGAGKTTITNLIPRLYDVDSGAVNIDGYNVKDIALATLGQIIGVVSQETYLFHTSVRENLLFARPDAQEEEMIEATKAASIHDRILELDHGYETIVGERGYKLSGGEKQRIAIARALLKNPRILILDEATSSLDTHSERLIQAALSVLTQDRTTFAIAHRLSTILTANLILVINDGKIVEKGTHTELLALNGLYAKLHYEQFLDKMKI